MQRHENRHGKINPAAPVEMAVGESHRQDQRNDPDGERNRPARNLGAGQRFLPLIEPKRSAQFPGAVIKQEDFQAESDEPDRVNFEKSPGLALSPNAQRVAESAV